MSSHKCSCESCGQKVISNTENEFGINPHRDYPKVDDVKKVGAYPKDLDSGGVRWDKVLEYRVYCNYNDNTGKCCSCETATEALAIANEVKTEANIKSINIQVIIQQNSWWEEKKHGTHVIEGSNKRYSLNLKKRIAEWRPEWLFHGKVMEPFRSAKRGKKQ